MLFWSPLDPDRKAKQELIVLRHGDERVLVLLPETYQDALEVSAQEFGLSGQLRFMTEELPGCDGVKVKIHNSAWKAVSGLLNSVIVELDEKPSAGAGKRRVSVVPESTSRVVVHEEGAMPSVSYLSSSRTRRMSRLSMVPSSQAAVGHPVVPRAGPLTPASSTSSIKNQAVVNEEQARASSTTLDLHEDMEVDIEDERMPSPKKSQRRRRQVQSDSEEPDLDVEEQRGIEPGEDEEIDIAEIKEQDCNPRAATYEQEHAPGPSVEQKRAVNPPPVQSSRVPEKNGRPGPDTQQKNDQSTTKVKKEHLSAGCAPKPESAPETSASQADSKSVFVYFIGLMVKPVPTEPVLQPRNDESFLVTIEYDDGVSEETQSLFKTRGRHQVSKVLMQACRTFGIPELFSRAHLVLIVDVEEDDEIVEHRFLCANNDTMARAGAEPNSKFVIQIDEDE
ncbi:hypothetical protein AcV7_001946 [Taiwanofungus camphoratus]|nr:hypothetical protein AcV7_001946 [Antrodia cinnamomea]